MWLQTSVSISVLPKLEMLRRSIVHSTVSLSGAPGLVIGGGLPTGSANHKKKASKITKKDKSSDAAISEMKS